AIVLKINPFDEPNVKESKDNTVRVITEYTTNGKLPVKNTVAHQGMFTLYGEPAYAATVTADSIAGILKNHFTGKKNEDYIALLAYIDQNSGHEAAMYGLREELTGLFGIPATVGFGPRYLHSTGQLHKGGKPNGIFLIITADEKDEAPIPGETFNFGTLKTAQALGDYQSFADRGYRLLHLHIHGTAAEGLQQLKQSLLH
ncbi:MAG: transaldolase, partial [Bacteroidetes bacterium]|nr:transaldolase [Bacteroidota bacterium]